MFSTSRHPGVSNQTTLATVLREAGVNTAGFNAANGFLSSYWGYDRGFDAFESFLSNPSGWGAKYLTAHPTVTGWLQLAASPFHRVTRSLRGTDQHQHVDVSHLLDLERRATEFLESTSEPYFLWTHYMDCHTSYLPAPKHLQTVASNEPNLLNRLRAHVYTGLGLEIDDRALSSLRSLYRGTVRQVDASIARLLETLEATGRRESTVVMIAGDHGEEFLEHGNLAHYPKLYDELIRVPLVMDSPGRPQQQVDRPVGLDSIPPTVCDALDVDASSFSADSLMATVSGDETPSQSPITSIAVRGEHVTQQPIPRRLVDGDVLVSARDDRFTYIYHTGSEQRELYDRAVDPAEQQNRFREGSVPETTLERLHTAVQHRLQQLQTAATQQMSRDSLSDGLDRRLQALGYK